MRTQQPPLHSYVIVGGGTAGWITAAVLGRVLRHTNASITLIESPDIATIGVGEATVPSFIDLLTILGIPEEDFIRQTNATFKLGIKFTGWQTPDHNYWHPFGNIGARIDGQPFFQHWLKRYFDGDNTPYTHYSPSAAIARENRFYIPDPHKPNNLSRLGYALHFDATLAANYLARYAQEQGVTHVSAHVEHVNLKDNGYIETVILKNGDAIKGDLFVDCTGQRARLMKDAMQVDFTSWQDFLPANAAVVAQTENPETLPPYTESIAHAHGWRWKIPLKNRTGNGYVYSSDYCSDEQAIVLLRKSVASPFITEPRILRFSTGVRQKSWHKNCVAIGLSAGFLEPLESTSIYLIMRGALNLAQLLPNQDFAHANEDEYNRIMAMEYECLRDFIVLHYCTSKRTDSPFWNDWQTRAIPKSLEHKLSLYQSQGRIARNEFDLFADDSWHAVLTGMGVMPNGYDPVIAAFEPLGISKTLSIIQKSLTHSVRQLMSHNDYLERLYSTKTP